MVQCVATTKRGAQCAIDAHWDSEFCHVHDPNGVYRQQHPKVRVKRAPKKLVAVASLPPADECETRVFTDGGCWPNPGQGGWAWVMEDQPQFHGAGREEFTTNQRMELTAALEAIRTVEGPLTVVSDSKYLVDCFTANWWVKWERNSWMRQEKGEWFPVKNADLWQPLLALVREWNVRFLWVKGHAGNVWNELADELAAGAMRGHEVPWGVDPADLTPMALVPRR